MRTPATRAERNCRPQVTAKPVLPRPHPVELPIGMRSHANMGENSHVTWSIRLLEQVRAQYAPAVSDGHVQGHAGRLLRLRAEVMRDFMSTKPESERATGGKEKVTHTMLRSARWWGMSPRKCRTWRSSEHGCSTEPRGANYREGCKASVNVHFKTLRWNHAHVSKAR